MSELSINYTDKDFESLRRAMLQLAQLRLPEWNDRSPADLGMLLVDLFAYMGDVILYYQDRIANEAFPQTAVERRSLQQLLRLIGYELGAPAAAVTELMLTFRKLPGPATATIPSGARFASQAKNGAPALEFQYLGPDLLIDLDSDQVRPGPQPNTVLFEPLTVQQGRAFGPLVVGSSSGEPNQVFTIADSAVIADSLQVEVNEGAGWVTWSRRDSLLFDLGPDGNVRLSSPDARVYQLVFDDKLQSKLAFGDGKFSRIPPRATNNIRVAGRTGGAALGNVGAASITEAKTTIAGLLAVVNPRPAAGGVDAEEMAHAARFGPEVFRSQDRAVTTSDYVALAHRAGGVAKARARSRNFCSVDLYVAPTGPECAPVPEALRRRLLAYFEDRRMAGTQVRVLDARAVPVDLSLELVVDERYRFDAVKANVEASVRALLAFAAVDFGQVVYLSDFYAGVEATPGVRAVTITRFRRRDAAPALGLTEVYEQYLSKFPELPPGLKQALALDVPPDGRIEVGEFEIPSLGELLVGSRVRA